MQYEYITNNMLIKAVTSEMKTRVSRVLVINGI